MKYKKYIFFLLLIMILGTNKTYAINNINQNDNLKNYSQISLINNDKVDYSNQVLKTSGPNVNCDDLFGSKNDPNSIKYMINEILQYPRIIVPILVIIFGIIDFGKAVIASKEDEMKKAQSTFIKRVIIGVAVFFVPAIVNIIMSLADIVWEGLGYTTCGL